MDIIEAIPSFLVYLLATYWKWVVGISAFVVLFWIESHIRARRVRRMGIRPLSSAGDLMYPYVSEAVLTFFIVAWLVGYIGTKWVIAGMVVYLALLINRLSKGFSDFTAKLDELDSKVDELDSKVEDLDGEVSAMTKPANPSVEENDL